MFENIIYIIIISEGETVLLEGKKYKMRKFEANKMYTETSLTGHDSKVLCVKVTAKTATFETVYGDKTMKINRETHSEHEAIYTSYGTMITA